MISNIKNNFKKILPCFLVILLFVAIFCGSIFSTKKDSIEITNEEDHTLVLPKVKGRVLEVYDNYLIVELAGNRIYEAGTENLECVENFQINDIVKITYSGNTLESMPGILVDVTNIELEEEDMLQR